MERTKGKAEEFFSKAGKKLDELFSEISASNISEKLELKERLNELKRNKESLEKEFDHFTEDNKEVFKDIANSFEESFEDIKNIFRKKKNQNG
jgi:putative cell wall-binding protein